MNEDQPSQAKEAWDFQFKGTLDQDAEQIEQTPYVIQIDATPDGQQNPSLTPS